MDVDWKQLKIGDVVRVYSWPIELVRERLHPSTQRIYDDVILRSLTLEVVRIDHIGIPYGKVDLGEASNCSEYVALNHSRIERA